MESSVLGLLAGVLGTVVLTVAEKIAASISGREPSTVPGQVAAKLTGRDPKTHPEVTQRLNPVVHWTHGIVLGAVVGLLALAGLSFLPATLIFFGLVWGGDVLLYRALGIAELPWKWSRSELLADLWGKVPTPWRRAQPSLLSTAPSSVSPTPTWGSSPPQSQSGELP